MLYNCFDTFIMQHFLIIVSFVLVCNFQMLNKPQHLTMSETTEMDTVNFCNMDLVNSISNECPGQTFIKNVLNVSLWQLTRTWMIIFYRIVCAFNTRHLPPKSLIFNLSQEDLNTKTVADSKQLQHLSDCKAHISIFLHITEN